jgi:pimeloyl-ACP methyl ester carboxylesterase
MIILIVFAALLVGGAVYHAYATRRDRQRYTPPGRLIDAGGFQMHLLPAGDATARPTVILDAGMVSFSSNWAWVQPEVAKVTQVVSYDRAGLGWSEPSSQPRDAQTSARELHTALENAGIGGPYVVVGHSYGGLTMRAFADLYPDEVAGLVLVDASHPDQWAHIPVSKGGRRVAGGQKLMMNLGRFGLLRLLDKEARMLAEGLPPQQYAEIMAFCMLPSSLAVSSRALAVWDEVTRPQINGGSGYGSKPLIVLSVTEQAMYADVLTRLQNELPTLSTNSKHITVEGATHENLVSNEKFARAVTDAILEVVSAVRSGQPLSQNKAA